MSVAALFLVFWLPGLAVGAAIRLRGWTLAAAGPILTFGLVALGAPVLGALGVRWSLAAFAGWSVAVAAGCLGASLLLARRRAPEPAEPGEADGSLTPWQHVLVAAGVAAGVVVGVVTFLRGIGGLGTVNQDWDAPFHANAVRWIAEHGDARPGALAPITDLPPDTDVYYPDTYHALLALLLDRAGLDMVELLNLGALAGVVAFPLGIAALTLAWRMPPTAAAAAAAVSTWFGAMPYDSLWRGPLWPLVAGIALMPAVLAVARRVIEPHGLAGCVGLPLAAVGLAGLHLSLMFVLAGYLFVLAVSLVLRLEPVDWRRAGWSIGTTAAAGLLLMVPVLAPAFSVAAGAVADFRWPEISTPAEAFGQVLLVSPLTGWPQWWLGLPALAGLVLLVRARRTAWLTGSYLLFGALYAGCASLDTPLVNLLTGPFYNDSWRLGALLSLGGAVAVGQAVHSAGGWLAARLDRAPARPAIAGPAVVSAAAVAVLVAVLAALSNGAYVARNADRLASNHSDGPVVSSAERDAYEWIAQRDHGARVMNDRLDGSVWMYALAGIEPVVWTYDGARVTSTAGLLATRLNFLGEDPRVEQALAELDVRYVVLGEGFIRGDTYSRGQGLRYLDRTPGLRKVYANSDATVYEVVAPSGPHDR